MPSSGTTEKEPAVRLEEVVAAYRLRHLAGDVDLLRRAFEVAEQAHRGQTRKSGEPFIHHPLSVTVILAEYGLDAATLAASLLHDTVEDGLRARRAAGAAVGSSSARASAAREGGMVASLGDA